MAALAPFPEDDRAAKALQRQTNHGDLNHRLVVFDEIPIVLA